MEKKSRNTYLGCKQIRTRRFSIKPMCRSCWPVLSGVLFFGWRTLSSFVSRSIPNDDVFKASTSSSQKKAPQNNRMANNRAPTNRTQKERTTLEQEVKEEREAINVKWRKQEKERTRNKTPKSEKKNQQWWNHLSYYYCCCPQRPFSCPVTAPVMHFRQQRLSSVSSDLFLLHHRHHHQRCCLVKGRGDGD